MAAQLEHRCCNTGLTYCGHPLACAAGVAALAAYRDEGLIDRSRGWARAMLERLRAHAAAACRHRRRARRDGLFAVVELVKDRHYARALGALAGSAPRAWRRFVGLGRERGVSFAIRGNLIILAPPLVIGENELEQAFDVLDALTGGARLVA